MGEIRELTSRSAGDVSPPAGVEDRASPADLPRLIRDPAAEPGELASALLECLLDRLPFERAFLLVPGGRGEDAYTVLASRARRSEGREREWRDVRNADFAVSRTVVSRAVAATEPIAVDSCLVRAASGGDGEQRTVLAAAFPISRDLRGVIYLDRGPGMDGTGPRERALLDELLNASAPALGRAWLAKEVARLEAEIERLQDDGEEELEPDEPGPSEPAGDEEIPCFYGIVGRDEKLLKIFHVIEKVKDAGLNVCIFGESGTGKELIARAIHDASDRREKRFISENCGAIAENLLESELFGHVHGAFTGADEDRMGLFQQADGGTLFLDEIGDMSEGMQRKLLRALQEGTIRPIGGKTSIRVDVRVLCASNRDLKHLVREGTFRADLYYRLNVIQIHVPSLRERREDIPLLMSHFTSELAKEEKVRKRFGRSALRAMIQYSWPGNVRELRNVIRRVLLTCPRRVVARKDVLPFLTSAQAAACLGNNVERDDNELVLRIPLRQHFNDIIEECERLVLLNALKENGWNKSRVTKALGIPRQSLYNKIARYDLQPESPGGE